MLRKALAALSDGDVLLVTRLDRLARSTKDLLNVLDAVAKARASFKSLADAWADTTTAHGRLMLTVLGGLAEFERELIKARTQVGIKRAREAGIAFGPLINSRSNSAKPLISVMRNDITNEDGQRSSRHANRPSETHICRLKKRSSWTQSQHADYLESDHD